MSLLRYIIADGIGAAIWAVAVGVLGYVFASSVQRLIDAFGSSTGLLTKGALAIVGGGRHRPGRALRARPPAGDARDAAPHGRPAQQVKP